MPTKYSTSSAAPLSILHAFNLAHALNPKLSSISALYSKWILGTVFLFVNFGILIATRYNILPATASHWISPVISTLMLVFVGAPIVLMSIKKPAACTAKLITAFAAILAFTTACITWSYNDIPQLFGTSSFILYILLVLTYFEERLLDESFFYQTASLDVFPKEVLRREEGQFVSVSASSIKVGNELKIQAGQTVPCDGTILSGITSVDESFLTGNSNPILKGKGDRIIGASVNRDSDIIMIVDRAAEDNVLFRIVSSLQQFNTNSSYSSSKTTAFAQSIAYLGVLVTVCVALYYNFLLYIPLLKLVPLLIATLLAFSMMSLAASGQILVQFFLSRIFQRGILLRNAKVLDDLSKIKVLFFDKTGTLTRGNFEYSQTFIELGTNQGRILSALFSLEAQSDHPLSLSMETHPWYHEIPIYPVRNFEAHSGLGVCGFIQPKGEREYFAAVGNLRFLKRMQMHVTRDMKNKIDDLEAMGETVLLCGFDRQVKGLVGFSDVLRPSVREALFSIKQNGIEPAIITGDSIEDLNHLSNALQLTKIYSRCTPEEKTAKVAKEINSGNTVGVVCSADDYQMFKNAHVTLTLDTGTDTSKHVTDVVLMNSDFADVSWLIAATRSLAKAIKINLGLAGFMATALAAMSALGLATPELVAAVLFVINLYFLRSSMQNRLPKIETSSDDDTSPARLHQTNKPAAA